MLRFAWIAVAVYLVFSGCEKKAESDLPQSGAVFTFRVDAPKPEGTSSMVEAVQRRLEAQGYKDALAVAKGPDRIRVTVPGLGESGVPHIKDLLTRPTRVAFSRVDEGREFFDSLKGKLPEDNSIRMEFDTYDSGEGGSLVRSDYLMAADKASLKKFLNTLTPPAGRKLWTMSSKTGALAYLIQDPPDMPNPVVTESVVLKDEVTGRPRVGITFDEKSAKAFAELTRKAQHRHMAILIGDEIHSLPVVMSPIEGGRAQIMPSPIDEFKGTKQEAQALAAGIKAWSLAGGLTLVEHQVVKPAAK